VIERQAGRKEMRDRDRMAGGERDEIIPKGAIRGRTHNRTYSVVFVMFR